jgi:hypothetical protein
MIPSTFPIGPSSQIVYFENSNIKIQVSNQYQGSN